MDKHTFFYGTQAVEFERPEVSEMIAKQGMKANLVGKKYNLRLVPTNTKVVIKVVHYKTK